MHCNPWYVSRYCCNYCIEEWSSRIERGFSPFSPPHTKTSGYCHHWRQFLNPNRCYHCRSNLYKFGAMWFDDNNVCNDSCCLKQNTILHAVNNMRWFHSLFHRNLWWSPSSFWFLFYFLCTCMYNSPSIDLLGTFNVYISL
jgi:hypothetical protein